MQFKSLFFGAFALAAAVSAVAVPQQVDTLAVRAFNVEDPTITLSGSLTIPIKEIEAILVEGAQEIAQVGGAVTKAGKALVDQIVKEISPYVAEFEKILVDGAAAIQKGIKGAAIAITQGLIDASKALAETFTYFFNLFVKYGKIFEQVLINELQTIAKVGVQLFKAFEAAAKGLFKALDLVGEAVIVRFNKVGADVTALLSFVGKSLIQVLHDVIYGR
ncbi:unnamed protein product [Tilletia controversa]|uniref:Cell wall mannoprotein 1 n=3 Tax=Tilletia TaxID=13289 RepID=A0A8X7MTJ1_9BASI|nr:hypothetical protein CF336_g6195 [Tilletia laevis]KAE8190939.1 hypothetical protein CF328_g5831 [Tilletia controversa]KAE8255439.1 hypothetical protein A4X03_0g5563 [Tilletia caries]KAE8194072.1 hypothetical protein CF335_g5431 [Tilletia laevis]KAE8247948.1 hypothetical protein A4X06_0g4071 [Tilletia controversa]